MKIWIIHVIFPIKNRTIAQSLIRRKESGLLQNVVLHTTQLSDLILRTKLNAQRMYVRINLFIHMSTSLQYHSNVLTLTITSLQNDP
jgi:hypothetical protein